ncbi:MAG: hypothetical protein J6562_05850 [Candidatus Schmidhempelia sp.]|nr:hypothetical protein [Candidatus Schmidhempelia sp.]
MKKLSLRTRLTLIISAILFIACCITTSLTYFELRDTLRQIMDSQQLLFAKRLSVLNTHGMMGHMGKKRMYPTLPSLKFANSDLLETDEHVLTFAIFSRRGELLLSDGENGQQIAFNPNVFKFGKRMQISETPHWRIVWLVSLDHRSVIAVGQALTYRQELLNHLIYKQIKPWLIMFVLLIVAMIVVISREFASLRQLTNDISARAPDEDSPIELTSIPKEVQPFVVALNALFSRISQTLLRERQFTSDAAHELRTPLAAMRVQAEVALLSEDNPTAQQHALSNLLAGIDRTSHMIDQLLTLSRLDMLAVNEGITVVVWQQIINNVIEEVMPLAKQKQITVQFESQADPTIHANAILLSILLRNLIHNAIRYIPEQGQITITLASQHVKIEDNGQGILKDYLPRLGERFYRPPGQKVVGSGLGLSIVRKIAELHNFTIDFYNKKQPNTGFVFVLKWI